MELASIFNGSSEKHALLPGGTVVAGPEEKHEFYVVLWAEIVTKIVRQIQDDDAGDDLVSAKE